MPPDAWIRDALLDGAIAGLIRVMRWTNYAGSWWGMWRGRARRALRSAFPAATPRRPRRTSVPSCMRPVTSVPCPASARRRGPVDDRARGARAHPATGALAVGRARWHRARPRVRGRGPPRSPSRSLPVVQLHPRPRRRPVPVDLRESRLHAREIARRSLSVVAWMRWQHNSSTMRPTLIR